MSAAEVVPVSLPRLRVVRQTIQELRVGMKEHYVITRTERGRSEWWAQGKVWSSGPGSIQLKQPGDVHRDMAHDGPITFQVIVLPESDIARVRAEAKLAALPNLAPEDERARPFHLLHDAIAAHADALSLEVAMTEAVAALTELRGAVPDQSRPVRRALAYLRERLGDAITLDDISLYAGLDKFHLCRAFRAQIGMPPHAYLTHLRIARAKELLKAGARASDVAARVGLYDQSQLNRHFRRLVGTTPARWASCRQWQKVLRYELRAYAGPLQR